GVVEPDGTVTLLNLRTGRVVFHPRMFRPEHVSVFAGNVLAGFPAGVAWAGLRQNGAPRKPASVLASHMQAGIQDILLLQDADQYYLVLNTSPPVNNVNNPGRPLGPWPNVQNLRHASVGGYVYAFHRTRGTLNWYWEVPAHVLVLERFEELPVLLF